MVTAEGQLKQRMYQKKEVSFLVDANMNKMYAFFARDKIAPSRYSQLIIYGSEDPVYMYMYVVKTLSKKIYNRDTKFAIFAKKSKKYNF